MEVIIYIEYGIKKGKQVYPVRKNKIKKFNPDTVCYHKQRGKILYNLLRIGAGQYAEIPVLDAEDVFGDNDLAQIAEEAKKYFNQKRLVIEIF